jgi:phospholipid/cholesterol/gamma-HCH transport system permease protein
MRNLLSRLGAGTISLVEHLGRYALFCLHALLQPLRPRRLWGKTIAQIAFIGAGSLGIVALVALFTGMVLGLQGYYTLIKFSAEGALGTVVALSLVRELGPVLTAIMVVARAGSSTAAELGIMRISEQIDALETMDIDPVRHLVTPRLVAALAAFPLLTAVFDVVGIFGGYLAAHLLSSRAGIYFSKIQSTLVLSDISGGFIKAVVFGFLVMSVCCYCGFHTHLRRDSAGARGVSASTTSAVVQSCVYVLMADYAITSFLM